VADVEDLRQRLLHVLDQLPESRDQRRDAPLDRPDVEDLRDERVAGLRPPHGAVALLMRVRSISVTRSSSLRIWPVKQSFFWKVTTSPGSASSTGCRSGPNDQITWSRDRKCCCGIRRRNLLVLDPDPVHVAQPL